ncbi:MAG TPA: hypothetical protein P5556_03285 [Candidatus Gastranaerophilales bacterium]|nr:hypothetical protein [Candidatus Gastranaerophilales bacterium]
MKLNLIKFLLFLLLFFNVSPGFCAELPEDVVNYVKQKFPEAKIRFDGLIELPDGTNYLPVLPLVYVKNYNTLEVTQTIPAKKDFSQKPDMALFNNNLALLKIIRKNNEKPTLISSPEMPLKVKLGILPQDLVVPKDLTLPPELKIILGDLKIPLKPKTDKAGEVEFFGQEQPVSNKTGKITGKTTEYVVKLPEFAFLADKKLYVSNYKNDKLNIVNSQTGRVEKSIILPSVAFDMMSPDKRYILMTAPALGQIFIVDTVDSEFVKTIQVGKQPSSIITPKGTNKAFVTNSLSSSISEIDLKNMQVTREIPVTGYPDKLQIVENEESIFYNDRRTEKVYQLNLKTGVSKELFKVKNISGIEVFGRYLLILSRSNNALTVYDLKKQEKIKETQTGEKPVDIKILRQTGKILILCAGSDELNIIDTENFDAIKKVSLESGGFPGKINLFDDESKALITNNDAYEIIIYNITAEKIQSRLPVAQTVSSVVISDK